MQVNREKLKERIRECRKKAGLTQEELAERLHVKRQIISYYESVESERTPNIDILATMADLFKTTTDYLLGLTDVESPNTKIKDICEYTGLSEQAVETLHSAYLPIAIDYDAELPDKEELDSLDEKRKKAEIQKNEMFEIINFFLISPKFYEAVKNLQKYLYNVADSTKGIENSLNELLNKKITAKKFYEDDLCLIEIDVTRNEKEDYNRLFYYEAVESLKNMVDIRCNKYIEAFEKAKLKMHYIYKSLFPINVSWSGITFGDIILGNYKELNENEIKELDKVTEILKQFF